MNPNTFSSKGITMPCRFLFSVFFLTLFLLCAQVVKASRGSEVLPDSIPISALGKFHIQGIAMDKEKRYLYVSYTTQLVKIDREGRIVGSVSGLLGHLGCIAFNPQDGKIYGSLEYKDDEIGRNINEKSSGKRESATQFYIASFDVEKINRTGMDGLRDGVMTAVCLPVVKKMFEGSATINGVTNKHVYGCSGIDGVSFGPKFGKKGGKTYLTVALGIYSDLKRTDNDYQVLLQYPWPSMMRYARPLDLNRMHSEGPAKPAGTYFAYTGNTTYGVQNLEYDPYSNQWFMAVYKGKKPTFPNYQIYAIDNSVKPTTKTLVGYGGERGKVVELSKAGLRDEATGVRGWNFDYGNMGMQALGDGHFYFFHFDKTNKEKNSGWLELYQYKPETQKPFVKVGQ